MSDEIQESPQPLTEDEINSLKEAVEIAGRQVGPSAWPVSLHLLARLEELRGSQ